MYFKFFLIVILLGGVGFHRDARAEVLAQPQDILRAHFPEPLEIKSRNILLSKDEQLQAQKLAKTPVKDRVQRFFVVSKGKEVVGLAALATTQVRTKNATALIILTPKLSVRAIEMVAFFEPPEYLPPKAWRDRFTNLDLSSKLSLKQDIPVISGATLSSKAILALTKTALAVAQIKKTELLP